MAVAILAACQTAAPAESSDAPRSEAPSLAASAAASDGGPSAGSGGACLDAEVVTALEDYGGGDIAADPPTAEVADALDGIELDGTAADARDRMVEVLRTRSDDTDAIVFASVGLWSEVNLNDYEC